MTKVSDVMTRGVRTLTPDDSLQQAAQAMESMDVGALPVCEDGRLVGMVTDRDLVLRGMAPGYPAESTRLDGMITRQVQCCREEDALDDVLRQMGAAGIRRLPVLDAQQQLVGMLTLGDVAAHAGSNTETLHAGQALSDISQPPGTPPGRAADPEHASARTTGTTGGGTAEDPSQQISS